jgi:phospholipid N-methyltransferase
MLDGLDLARAHTVVEAGPGTGAFTGAILEACGEHTWVLAVELNADFAARLEGRYPRLHVVRDSVEHLPTHLAASGRPLADVVLSGLPWALMSPEKQRLLLRGISDGLRVGGVFVTFGYVHCSVLPRSRSFHRLTQESFTDFRASRAVWQNLPPAIVYRWRKRDSGPVLTNEMGCL